MAQAIIQSLVTSISILRTRVSEENPQDQVFLRTNTIFLSEPRLQNCRTVAVKAVLIQITAWESLV